jgi:arylsulfatase
MTAGASVFLFGTSAALFGTLAGRVTPRAIIDLTAENIIYYAIFLISGVITWLLLRCILSRLSRRPSIPIAVIALIAVLPLIIFLRPAESDNPDKHNPNPGNKGKNLLFISIDTLRYDRLGCDFNDAMQTPNIDALARDSVIFDNCVVPMPLTVPSHYSMFTGLIPRNHGIRVQASPINPNLPTITGTLSQAGFTCGGFVSMSLLDAFNSGLDKGFQYYDDFRLAAGESRFFPREVKYFIAGKIINKIFTGRGSTPNRYERKAENTVDSALKWLDAVQGDDFFCFVHLFDPHWDYNAPEPYKVMYDPDYNGDLNYHFYINRDIVANRLKITKRDFDYIVSRYDGEVSYADSRLGRLFNRLKELGLWDETMIILTADHGESFEHGYFFEHPSRVYQSTIHVPLIIKPFNSSGMGRAGRLCSITDLFPTICDAFGQPTPQGLDGVSLMPLVNGEAGEGFLPHQLLFSEAYPLSVPQSIGRIYCIIKGTDKLIYSPYAYPFEPTYQFYNIALDPGEEHNIYDPSNGVCDELAKLLDKWAAADTSIANPLMERINMENLKTLQYLH